MKINDLVEFEGSYFLILSDPFIMKGKDNSSLHVVKVVDLLSQTIDLLKIENNKIKDKINWCGISSFQVLSESFIKEFQNKVYWGWISYYQTLSESFIREFQNKVNWGNISCYQTLSESFIREFQNKVSWDHIFRNENISDKIKEKFRLEGKFCD